MSKQLIGVNLGAYTFDATNKQVTLSGIDPLTLDQILLITNVTTNTIIYNFADSTLGGSISANVITLTYDTTSMNNTDILQVFVEYPDAAQPTAFSITGPSGFVADVTNSKQLKVSTPPPTPPAAVYQFASAGYWQLNLNDPPLPIVSHKYPSMNKLGSDDMVMAIYL